MPRYGFKVHKLELARGVAGRSKLEPKLSTNAREQKKCAGSLDAAKNSGDDPPPPLATGDYLVTLVEVLQGLHDRAETLTDVPRLVVTADGADDFIPSSDPGTPRFEVSAPVVAGRRVSVEVTYGHLGWAQTALAADKSKHAPLTDMAPGEPHRIEFLVPSKGTTGMVAAEAIARGTALPALTAWINHTLRTRDGDARFVRLMTPQLADAEQLKHLLTSNTVAEIQLKRVGVGTDGVPGDGVITVREQVRLGSKIQQAQQLIQGWSARLLTDGKKKKLTSEEVSKQIELLAAVVDPAIAGMQFDDGVIKLDPGSGRKIEVRPTRIGEIFTYPISEAKPPTSVWEAQVGGQLMAMAEHEGLSVGWA